MNVTPSVKLTPLIPNLVPKNKVFVCPESSWMPDSDGAWQLHPFAFDRWDVEEMSYYDTCSLHCALNPFNVFEVHGADYLKMLEFTTVNTFRKFPVGKARHAIFCDDGGKILTDGIVIRTAEEDFLGFNLVDPAFLNQQMGGMFDIQSRNLREEYFVFQLCGARSLEVVEQACQADLHDLKFMYSCTSEVEGMPVRVLRTGMAGTLAYEIHGNVTDAQADIEREPEAEDVHRRLDEKPRPRQHGAAALFAQLKQGQLGDLAAPFPVVLEDGTQCAQAKLRSSEAHT